MPNYASFLIGVGNDADKPQPGVVNAGSIYFTLDTQKIWHVKFDGSDWEDITPPSFTNPMTSPGDMIFTREYGGAPAALSAGLIGNYLKIAVVGNQLLPSWGSSDPTFTEWDAAAVGTSVAPENTQYILIPNLTGDATITLPDAVALNLASLLVVKAQNLNSHVCTINTQNGNVIDGASSLALATNQAALILMGDARYGGWHIIGRYLT